VKCKLDVQSEKEEKPCKKKSRIGTHSSKVQGK
jgi:hypothetical protein